MLNWLKYSWRVLRTAGTDFGSDNCFRSSAALSFYTLFSMAPIVWITISVASIFVDSTVVRDEITGAFRNLIGDEGSEGVFALLDTLRTQQSGVFAVLTGLGVLVFSATTILVQIKNGFNEIFKVRAVEGRKGWLKIIVDRLVSMGLILSLGFAMIISLMLDTLIVSVVNFFSRNFEALSLFLLQALQNLIAFGLIYLVIYSMFRWLSDVDVDGKFLLRGALFTTVVLLIGKFAIGWYIGQSNLAAIGGAASSVVVLMLWVYYSSVILFFGAEVVKAQTLVNHQTYKPSRYARKVKLIDVEQEST
ncbi:MAG: YihY/virulence factor BrkB family protein [Pseudohongiellaceae bacterium]